MRLTLNDLSERLDRLLGEQIAQRIERLDELTVEVAAADLPAFLRSLREHGDLRFEQLIDLCGVDYRDYGDGTWEGRRYAVVYHLLSLHHNVRLRVRTFCQDDDFPVLASACDIWPSANWYEREAFDLFGIIFEGHPDLRRILTDYGFVGHPFRKDFPLSGEVEMRYDPEQRRVIYQPVSIEPREVTPRIVRDDAYGDVQ